jgi:hypothetical protein
MKKWYQKDWGIFTLLILFLPVGLYILWKKSDWSSSKKITVTSCFALLFLIGLIFEPDNSKSNFSPGQTYSFAGYPNGCNSDYGCMYYWYVDFKKTKATFYTKKDGDNYKYCRRDVAYIYNEELQTIEFTKVLDDSADIANVAGECLQGVIGKWDYRFSDPETRSMPIVQVRQMGLITYDGFYKSSDGSIDSPRFSKK